MPAVRSHVSDAERAALQAFVAAWEAADTPRLVALLCEDARWAMPPAALWFEGRAAIERLYTLYPIDLHGRAFKLLGRRFRLLVRCNAGATRGGRGAVDHATGAV
jgi:RNA polymerase sigma-70 factor, ECF subfamily